ncbi:hypothetical protein LTR43_012449 [Exophiala xenobiotica]|nr:hypothetical protein LTR14_012320 [Exophiala xenobiotica]KAK5344083.1 hypothetical protein LTR43_012449 [Exophiala xenobiotica]
MKITPRKKFSGTSLDEIQGYLNGWRLIFDLDPDLLRIRQTATELAETAALTWLREPRETRPTTWEGYTTFLTLLRKYLPEKLGNWYYAQILG